jgi:hypothetical protein
MIGLVAFSLIGVAVALVRGGSFAGWAKIHVYWSSVAPGSLAVQHRASLTGDRLQPTPAQDRDHREHRDASCRSDDRDTSGIEGLGIRVAIDDFGTGYSSLSYLKRLPVDTLKIDRSFVSGLGHDAQDTAIVDSIVALARTLHLSVTGEGVETEAQARHLKQLGCQRGQGFLYARPLPPEDVERLLVEAHSPSNLQLVA